MEKAQVYAKHNNARISARKVRVVMDLVQGKSLMEAKKILAFDSTKAAKMILKVVKSAEANAQNNLSLSSGGLIISDIYANEAQTLKRWRAATKGRVNPIFKRSCHIVVGLKEVKKE
ncbi:50S ribosomal protein L22 [Patescibacteria group bacterium]